MQQLHCSHACCTDIFRNKIAFQRCRGILEKVLLVSSVQQGAKIACLCECHSGLVFEHILMNKQGIGCS